MKLKNKELIGRLTLVIVFLIWFPIASFIIFPMFLLALLPAWIITGDLDRLYKLMIESAEDVPGNISEWVESKL